MYSISYDKTVYSDAGLTTPVAGPFDVPSTTVLPDGVYFSATEYSGTGKNSVDDELWTVRFTYPDHVAYIVDESLKKVLSSEISVNTGAIYDE